MGLPQSVIAAGWIPFIVCAIMCLLFSTVYILWFRSTKPKDKCLATTVNTISALTVTLMGSALVPVDVFLVSYMKYSNGTYKEWAVDPEVRSVISSAVMTTYYIFYGVILTYAFLLLPMNYFFHAIGVDEDPVDDDEYDHYDIAVQESCLRRLLRSFKYTSACIVAFGILVVLGIFIPFDGEAPYNSTTVEKFQWILEDFEATRGQNLLVFLVNVLNVIGMVLLITYTGYGMSTLPCGMVRGGQTVHTQRDSLSEQLEEIGREIRMIRAEIIEGGENQLTTNRLARLEQRDRLLRRSKRDLDQTARSFVNMCILIGRPFQLLLGACFTLMGFMIFLSLLLTSVDKALHSGGAKSGYVLVNGTLPNPVDAVLVYAVTIFPLDYVFYCAMILFMVFCSMSGVKNVGIRFMWLTLYRIRAGRTKPQALVLVCLNLIFTLLALNVVMFSVVPDYTTYGSQNYVANLTNSDNTSIEDGVIRRCSSAPTALQQQTECNMSRIAVLLLAFHYKAWIFGAAYYFLIWGFLIIIVIGSVYALYRMRGEDRGFSLHDENSSSEEDEEVLIHEDAAFFPAPELDG